MNRPAAWLGVIAALVLLVAGGIYIVSLGPSGSDLSPPLVTLPPAQAPQPVRRHRPPADTATLAGLRVVETASGEDGSPAVAALQWPGGAIRRIAIGEWVARNARLAAVSDNDATFDVDGELIAIQVREAEMPASPTSPTEGIPGIDFNANPGKAQPAIARRLK